MNIIYNIQLLCLSCIWNLCIKHYHSVGSAEHGVIQFQGTIEVKNCQFLLSKVVGSTIFSIFFAIFLAFFLGQTCFKAPRFSWFMMQSWVIFWVTDGRDRKDHIHGLVGMVSMVCNYLMYDMFDMYGMFGMYG